MNADPVLVLLPGAFFALLFGIAATHKLLAWRVFQQQVIDYKVLPRVLETPAAIAVPALEVLAALGWLDGATRPAAALLSAALLGIYAGAMAWNLRRGRDTIDCGCGGADGAQVIRWALVVRNGLLALAALPLAAPVELAIGLASGLAREPGWIDWLSINAGALVLMGMYIALNQVLANLPPQRVLD